LLHAAVCVIAYAAVKL